MTRTRTATTAVKLAALTTVAALATGGLAAAGAIELPNPLPDQASDQADAVHEAIQGSDPAAEHQNAAAEAQDENGKLESAEDDVDAQGADPQEGAGQAFGDSVSDRASGGEPKENGREFGESVSDEAQQLVPRPEPQGGPETGEENAQEQETPEPPGEPRDGRRGGGHPRARALIARATHLTDSERRPPGRRSPSRADAPSLGLCAARARSSAG